MGRRARSESKTKVSTPSQRKAAEEALEAARAARRPVPKPVSFPERKRAKTLQPGKGVSGVRRQPVAGGTTYTAKEIGLMSPLFPGGAEAFAHWVHDLLDYHPTTRMTRDAWAGLLEQFAARPIHGHRRSRGADNHKAR